ncbi:MAG TPA: hypothetical protein VFJ04_06825 [Rhodanobacteraceae bacterium]|jgi:hypothetical protein|nr:hypothetical protein [Rhodanobacteraceae bacterium]
MGTRHWSLGIVAACALAGCSRPPQPPVEHPPQPQAAASVARVKTPFDSLLKDRDRAKAVQQQVDAQAKAQQAAIDAQTR